MSTEEKPTRDLIEEAKQRGLGWTKREPTPSDEWAEKNLPPTPLAQHLISLHLHVRHLLAWSASPYAGPVSEEDRANILALVEHHLREIAVFTRPDPFAPRGTRGW